jgi:hypothetical protein
MLSLPIPFKHMWFCELFHFARWLWWWWLR